MPQKAPPILIVDDNVEFASLLGTLFAEQGLVPILAHTASNALTLSKVYQPAAVIVDLLLPDMTGHKLLAQLKAPNRAFFVITGVFKGQAQMERVRQIVPITAWYEKPFDTRVLVEQVMRGVGREVVERESHRQVEKVTSNYDINILDPVEAEGIRVLGFHEKKPAPPPSDDDDLDIEVDVELDEKSMAMWETVQRSDDLALVVDDLATDIPADEVDEELNFDAPMPPPRSPSMSASPFAQPPLRSESGSGFLRDVSPTPKQLSAGLRAKMRTGPLRAATVPRLLTAFHLSYETGEIAFERRDERKVIYFHEGRPVNARSNQDADRIGTIARKTYGLSGAQIEHALATARKKDRMLGEVLIEQKLIPESSRHELLREQTRTIIRSLLTWSEGRYVIGFSTRPDPMHVELNEHPAALVLQGVRELFDLDRLRRLVPDRMRPMPSPNAPYELYELPMRDAEAVLLLRSTGARTVRALLNEVSPRLGEHEARAHIYGLLMLGILFSGRATKEVS